MSQHSVLSPGSVIIGLALFLCGASAPTSLWGQTSPLNLFTHPAHSENMTTATAEGERSALQAGYQLVRMEGLVFPAQVPGAVPLKLYWHSSQGGNPGPGPAPGASQRVIAMHQCRLDDYLTIATAVSEQEAQAAGYRLVRVVGFIYPNWRPGTVPLKLFWQVGHNDNLTSASPESEQAAQAAGYQFVRVEGYVLPGPQGAPGPPVAIGGAAPIPHRPPSANPPAPLEQSSLPAKGASGTAVPVSPTPGSQPAQALRPPATTAPTSGAPRTTLPQQPAQAPRPPATTAPAGGAPNTTPSPTAGPPPAQAPPPGTPALQPTGSASPSGTPSLQQSQTYGPFYVCSDPNSSNGCRLATGVKVRARSLVVVRSQGKINFGGGIPNILATGLPIPGTVPLTARVLDADGDDRRTPDDFPSPFLRDYSLLVLVGQPPPPGSTLAAFGGQALIGKWYQGGTGRSFMAGEDGELVLMPNDKDVSKDRGVRGTSGYGWEVGITVLPPLSQAQQQALDTCVRQRVGSQTQLGPLAVIRELNARIACMKELGLASP